MKNKVKSKPGKVELMGMHHIAIICSDYNKSKEFYTEVLGFSILRETFRKEKNSYKLDLVSGSTRIELFSFPNTPKRLSLPEATGLRHVAFVVDKVEKVAEKIIRSGVEIEPIRVDKTTGKKFTFFFDPDSLPIEIYEE